MFTAVWLLLLLLLPLSCPIAAGDDGNATSGAEFLKNVMGNLRGPDRRVFKHRIDVEEHIPDDFPRPGQSDDIQMLSRQPGFNVNVRTGRSRE